MLLSQKTPCQSNGTIADRLLEEVRRSPDCELNALVQSLPDLTWEDVLLEVHRLSSTEQLQLTSWGAGVYTVRVTNQLGLTPAQDGRATIREASTPVRPAS
jgi:hypothetical protein